MSAPTEQKIIALTIHFYDESYSQAQILFDWWTYDKACECNAIADLAEKWGKKVGLRALVVVMFWCMLDSVYNIVYIHV